MKIPRTYYFEYWLKNSLLALSTGALISFLVPPFFIAYPYFGILVCLAYQLIIYRHLFGSRKGDFEFFAKEHLNKKRINSIIKQHLGADVLMRYKIDSLNSIVDYGWTVYAKLKKILKSQKKEVDYILNIMAANLSQKEGNHKKEQRYLLEAQSSRPDDLISNFRIAVTLEKEGLREESINQYSSTLTNSLIESSEFKVYKTKLHELKEKARERAHLCQD